MNRLNFLTLIENEEATKNNFFYANKTTTQAVLQNTFVNITYNNPLIKGWTYSSGQFTCGRTGIYSIDYTCLLAGLNAHTASVRITINSIEAVGSTITQSFTNNSQFTNSCLIKINKGNVLSLQVTGGAGTETISTILAIAGESPVLSSLKVTLLA